MPPFIYERNVDMLPFNELKYGFESAISGFVVRAARLSRTDRRDRTQSALFRKRVFTLP